MSKAVEVIEEEMRALNESINNYTYHLVALRDLRKKIINEEAEYIEPPKPLIIQRSTQVRVSQKRVNEIAKVVARLIRTGKAKAKNEALKMLQEKGRISFDERVRMKQKMIPCHMGKDLYDATFAGTKYAK